MFRMIFVGVASLFSRSMLDWYLSPNSNTKRAYKIKFSQC